MSAVKWSLLTLPAPLVVPSTALFLATEGMPTPLLALPPLRPMQLPSTVLPSVPLPMISMPSPGSPLMTLL